MTALAYYNEIDPFAAAWLRSLISAGHIAPGDVDERNVLDVRPDDLRKYVQCHFFAGVGVWSYALRRAGWPDDRRVWTGSCPCQPFSAAGKGGGFTDERHLWPAFEWLISQYQPYLVLGEQVASKDGLAWLDLVFSDMEGSGHAIGAVDTCSAGSGAPHIRQRIRFAAERLAFTDRDGRNQARIDLATPRHDGLVGNGTAGGLANADDNRLQGRAVQTVLGAGRRSEGNAAGCGVASLVATRPPGPTNSLWRDADWLFCRDGKWRPVEPGTFPLAHGAPARMGRLRGYGNAVDAEATANFIQAYLASEAGGLRDAA